MKRSDINALIQLKACKSKLTTQQFKTLRGQIFAGDADGALRGLRKLLSR